MGNYHKKIVKDDQFRIFYGGKGFRITSVLSTLVKGLYLLVFVFVSVVFESFCFCYLIIFFLLLLNFETEEYNNILFN